jgi:exopolyphosphatase / guanosine-5'-triphosphate,3'-diphosphate pyrophosphatase
MPLTSVNAPASSDPPVAPAAPAAGGRIRPAAVVDIGARAIRLDVAEIHPDGHMRILESLQQPVSLGKDTFGEGRIDRESIEECVDILKGFRHVMREYGITAPDQIRAVATSSVREAANREAFLDRIYIATGLSVDVLEDAEVEHLIHLAIHDLFEKEPALQTGNVLIAEVGGGSTRVLLIQDGYVTYSGAYRLGALRMREALDAFQPPPERMLTILNQHIQRIVNQMRDTLPARNAPYLVALAGDMETAMRRLLPGWNGDVVTRVKMAAFSLAEDLASTAPEVLMRKHHLPPQEAETAGQALLVYSRMARTFGVRELLVTDKSMRRGLLMKMVGTPAAAARFSEQLGHSAAALGQRYHFDEKHARQVADLSARLYRELAPEHGLGAHEGVLLHTAALLHDIGAFVSNTAHHKHSMYLIMNSELFGLSRQDTTMIALVARYHRRAAPRASHPEYMLLDREGRLAVGKLAAILRVADALDRSHLQHLRDIAFERQGRRFIITVADVEDVTLERLALREKADMFEEVFGLEVALRTSQTMKGSTFEG